MDKKTCDVAVIGAGIGGLCVAARLAHAGYKTIVLERMPILGGRYNYIDYKGYLLPTGAGCIWAGPKDPVYRTLIDVNANVDFETKAVPPQKWRINGKDYEVPGIAGVLGVLSVVCELEGLDEKRILTALGRAFAWREPSDDITFKDWVLQLTDSKTINNIFQAICVMLVGPNAAEISAGDFFRLARPYVDIDAPMLLPRKGLGVVVDSLAKVIRANKGELFNLMRAQRIIVQDGKATGVKAKGPSGELQIEAKVVVSDVGPKKTVELAGEQNFDQGYLKDVRGLKPWAGISYVVASTGPLYDSPGGLYTIDTRRAGMWVDMTLIWPEWAPKGRNWMYFYEGTESAISYNIKKEYEAFLADLHDTFPNFEKQKGEILLIHRYDAEWPCLRAWPTADRHRRTPVEDLYNVGDAVIPAGSGWNGGSGAADSARVVAEDIKARIKV